VLPTPDTQSFELNVYPVLLRDCGFPTCHGNPERFFRVFGPGRTRILPREQLPLFAPATAAELTATYDRARSMLVTEDGIDNSMLLQKPLEAHHGGTDEWGNNVYLSAADPSYQILRAWAHSFMGPAPQGTPGGTPPGTVGAP
jgi:hypothetical protein